VNNFGSKLAEKIGILVQGGAVNVGEIRLDGEMSRQEFRNRKALLNNVRTAWVEGVLEKSLHEQIPIILGLENHPSAVASPWNLDVINPDQSRQPLPTGTPVIDVFDQLGEGGTLLILGEAGSGKTITLLQLARDLIARAEEEIVRRIPVVLNLSSWAAEKQTIAKWIIEELNNKYLVNRKIGQQWVEKQELFLLLDGLDEIRDLEKRNACVTALNDFQQEQATEMIICCRVKDYRELGDRLKLKSALVLQSLTNAQVQAYLARLQSNLTLLKSLLIEDVTLQELAQSPLLLNIMVLAYQGIEVGDMPTGTIVSNRKKQLFNDYINRIFQGSRIVAYHLNSLYEEKYHYSRKDATHWLVSMAQQMTQYSQTVFLIEKMQPSQLKNGETIFYRIGSSLIISPIWGLIFGLFAWLISQVDSIIVRFGQSQTDLLILYSSLFGIFLGLFFELMGGMTSRWSLTIEPIESIKWSWKEFKKQYVEALIFGLTWGLRVWGDLGLRIWLTWGQSWILLSSLYMGLLFAFYGVVFALILGIPWAMIRALMLLEIEETNYPNQGIIKSAVNALFLGLLGGLIGLIIGLIYELDPQVNGWLMTRLIVGLHFSLIFGFGIGLRYGGIACIQHFVLRLILYFTKRIPWNYAKFLDWASDKLFLQKVGGGYIFIHRSLMEHFAEMESSQ